MKKELIDFIGAQLFGSEDAGQKLQLKSEKQFRVNVDGSLVQEQSVCTDIVVDKNAIILNYRLPGGEIVSFVNAITEVDYQVNNDYTIHSIIYTTVPAKSVEERSDENVLFILSCDDQSVKIYGAQQVFRDVVAKKVCYQIE